jgi:hypothetical protein
MFSSLLGRVKADRILLLVVCCHAEALVSGMPFFSIVAVCLIDALAYHLAVSGAGNILVRPGLRWTYGLMPFHLGRAVETDTNLSDLNPVRDDFFRSLGNVEISGLAGHVDDTGLRPSHFTIKAALRRTGKASTLALAEVVSLYPENDPAPLEETAFLSQLKGRPPAELSRQIYPLPEGRLLACDANPQLNFKFDSPRVIANVQTGRGLDRAHSAARPSGPVGRGGAIDAACSLSRLEHRAESD